MLNSREELSERTLYFPDSSCMFSYQPRVGQYDWRTLSSHACMWSYFSHSDSFDPMGCILPGSSVPGILQARILEWVAMPSSRGSSWPRDWTLVFSLYLHWQVGSLPLVPPGKPKFPSSRHITVCLPQCKNENIGVFYVKTDIKAIWSHLKISDSQAVWNKSTYWGGRSFPAGASSKESAC